MNNFKQKICALLSKLDKCFIIMMCVTLFLLTILLLLLTSNERPETQIVKNLEKHRQMLTILDREIQNLDSQLKAKLEQRKPVLTAYECELNQLARIGNGEPVDKGYCSKKEDNSIVSLLIPTATASNDAQTTLRKERLQFCQDELYKLTGKDLPRDLMLNKYEYEIFNQNAIVRCATFATIVYARESNSGKDCKRGQINCYGNNGYHYRTSAEYVEHFARTYWRFNRHTMTIPSFVKNYMCGSTCESHDGRLRDLTLTLNQDEINLRYNNYVNFAKNNYWKIYGELEILYSKL